MARGMHGRGTCMAGGMCGREGACIVGGTCMRGGVCVAGKTTIAIASYWNAFLYEIRVTKPLLPVGDEML